MGWSVIDQARVAVRPAGEVRVSTCRNASTVLLTVLIGEQAMVRAGLQIGAPMRLLRGDGEDAGWVRVEKSAATADARVLGKMPGTKAGAARFRVPKDWDLPMVSSTGIPEHEVQIAAGSVTLRLPPMLRGEVAEGSSTMPVSGPAVSDKAPPPTPIEARLSYRTAARSDLLRKLWPLTGMSAAEIRAKLSVLDGPEIPATKTVLYHWAEALGMPTNRSLLAADVAIAPEAASISKGEAPISAAAATVTPQQATPSPSSGVVRSTNGLASRAALPTEHPDKADAVLLLEDGKTARYVAEEFGLPIATVATWAAEVRARQQAGKAA